MVFSCAGGHWDELVKIDPEHLRAPGVLGVSAEEDRVVKAVFDKEVWLDKSLLAIHPDLHIEEVKDGSSTVLVTLLENGLPGRRYTFEAMVKDARGNTTSFLYHFYGFNPRVPALLINEFITTSSTTVFTRMEIAVRSDGNMGGVTFFEGTKSYADKTFVFPSFEVKKDDYIVLHFKPDGLPGEIDETEDKTAATGKGASPTAFDFWAQGTGNLSKENDVLTLYSNPEGRLLDGVLYTIKEYEEGMKYNGFGTSLMLNKAKELVADGGWKIAGDELYPRDGVNPKGATSTRSLCRSGDFGDTDCAEDWHIVPTGKASFGKPNSDERYTP
jgi:hypothetical protein